MFICFFFLNISYIPIFYVRKVHIERRLSEAVEMINRYLDPRTKQPLLSIIELELLKPHVQTIVDRGLRLMLENQRFQDIKRMYLLFNRIDSTDLIRANWIDYVSCCLFISLLLD